MAYYPFPQLGQANMAGSLPVVIASNQSAFPVTQSSGPWTSNLTQIGGNAVASAGQNGVLSIGGQQATNNNISTNAYPVLIGGSDYGGTAKIQTMKVDSSGNQQMNVTQIGGSALALGQTTMSASLPVTLANNQAAIAAWGQGATAATVPTGAQYIGGDAATSLPTATSGGQLTGVMVDKFGRQVVLPHGMRDLILPITQLTLTSTTSETTLIGQVASTFLDILTLIVINTSATATQVDFRDSTGGTIRASIYVPAGDTRGVSLNGILPQNTVNNNWTAKCGTSVASVIITGTYITNK